MLILKKFFHTQEGQLGCGIMERRSERDSDKGGNGAAKQWGRKRESGGEVEKTRLEKGGDKGREGERKREGKGGVAWEMKSHYGILATLRGRCPHL